MQASVAFNVTRVLRASNVAVWNVLGDFGTGLTVGLDSLLEL